MALDETETRQAKIIEMIKQGDLSRAPELYEQTQKIIRYAIRQEWGREYIRRGATARGIEIDDLLQEGYFMMIASAKNYDAQFGAQFSSYLFIHIKTRIKAMTAPRKIDDAISISKPFGIDEDSGTLEEVIADPSALDDFAKVEDRDYLESLRSDLNESIEELTSEQAAVIRGKYLSQQLVKDLAYDLKIAEKRISAIEERALRSLSQSKRLQMYREDIISRYSLRGTLSAFKNTGTSAVERAVIKLDELERRQPEYLESKERSAAIRQQRRIAMWAEKIHQPEKEDRDG